MRYVIVAICDSCGGPVYAVKKFSARGEIPAPVFVHDDSCSRLNEEKSNQAGFCHAYSTESTYNDYEDDVAEED